LHEKADLPQQIFRNRIRSVRRLARQVGEAMRKRGDTAQDQGMQAYRKLVMATQQTIEQAQQVLPVLQVVPDKGAKLGAPYRVFWQTTQPDECRPECSLPSQ
jgi:hypothetical protein